MLSVSLGDTAVFRIGPAEGGSTHTVRLASGAIEIKLGVVTALIGVPFFVAMIFGERRMLEDAP